MKDPDQRWDMKTIVKFIKDNKENFFGGNFFLN